MGARPINVNEGKGEIVRAVRKSGRDRELVNGVVNKLEQAIIPSGNNTPRGPIRGFEDEGPESRRKEGGGEEGGHVSEFCLL
jgi:hypothetical protein